MSKKSSGGLVYSTEFGRACPDCRQPQDQCTCKQPERPLGDGIVRVSRDSKGRGGKVVTLVTGVPLADAELKDLAKALKQRCGVGGALKDGVIEIQGDQRELLVAELSKRGFTVKKAGG
ncbi:translation initiation factor Sui1 [Venatoribacter cucullus]|uniref:Translation initiation factor Sui1 n=1 Tax=Venatoribacter cucullus TaxID=2661630 RepID=A0A9X7UZC1_9GAMM|nr:translation initiation factor Sui1 [Venatoribacter cucullus]QQD24758.1 translation initiation factor Sui1 [Venatoribacter cucullus]